MISIEKETVFIHIPKTAGTSIEKLLGHFDTLVSGAEATRSKPYPDPYLAALRILDAPPSRAVALEDSLTGYRAALAAGIKCVICPDHFIPKPDGCFPDAALVVESLAALDIDRLKQLFHNTSSSEDRT